MSLTRPTLSELQIVREQDLALKFGLNTPLLPKSVVKVVATAQAGADNGQYGYIDSRSKEVLPDSATTDFLDRWAVIYGISRKDASFAIGSTTFTGVETTIIPSGTVIVRADGEEFTTDAIATITGGVASVAITASTAGILGNTAATTILSLSTPISGIDPDTTVDTGGITGGADIETDVALRIRILERIQFPSNGGNESFYVQIAKTIDGVTRVFVLANFSGAGTVRVFFVEDDNPVSIIPGAAKVAEVQAAIDLVKPLPANVTVSAPVAKALDITVDISPNISSVQTNITAELDDLLIREAAPGATILLSKINEAISIADGEDDHDLLSPVADVGHIAGEIAILGTIIYGTLP